VRKNGDPYDPGDFAKVTAVGGNHPYDYANSTGWYVLDPASHNGGMVDGQYYSHCKAEWYDDYNHKWGGWCPGDTFHLSPHVPGKHISITWPPTEYKDY
jgi:hypothetical protein